MRVRKLTAVAATSAAVALVISGLTACDSKVGQAAIVGGHRISESELGGYVTPAGPSPSVISAAAAAKQSVYPKTEVVQILVQQQLFEKTLAKNGGIPTAAELATLHDQAAATFLGTQLTGAALDSYLQKTEGFYGYSSKYDDILLRTVELEATIAVRVKAVALADVTGAVNKLHLTVQVNPRYGKWDPATLSLGDPNTNIPDFLKLNGVSTPSPSPAPTAAQGN